MALSIDQQECIVGAARRFKGIPHVFGTYKEPLPESKKPKQLDCVTLVRLAFRAVDIDPGITILDQAANPNAEEIAEDVSVSCLVTGDLLFFEGTRGWYDSNRFGGRRLLLGHVAMFIGQPFSSEPSLISSRHKFGGVVEQALAEVQAEPSFTVPTLIKRF